MDRLISIPERDFGMYGEKQPTPLSTDVFVSIPERDYFLSVSYSQEPPLISAYHAPIRSDVFN